MRVKFSLFLLGIFLLSSCTYEQPADNNPGKALIFIIDDNAAEPKFETFVVEEENDLAWFEETKQQRYQQNLRRYADDYEDEQEEFEFKSKLRNVRRIIENDFGQSELIIGYDKELDNPDFKEVDY